MFVRCNYKIGKFEKFIKGELILETKEKVVIKSDVNENEVTISYGAILELVKFPQQRAAKK